MLLRAVGTWTPSRELLVQQFYSYAILTRTPFDRLQSFSGPSPLGAGPPNLLRLHPKKKWGWNLIAVASSCRSADTSSIVAQHCNKLNEKASPTLGQHCSVSPLISSETLAICSTGHEDATSHRPLTTLLDHPL